MLKKWIKRLKGDTEIPSEVTDPTAPDMQTVHRTDENVGITGPEAEEQNEFTVKSGENTSEDNVVPESASSKNGLFSRLRERMSKSRRGFVHQMDSLLLGRRTIDPELLDELEEILIMADMGVETVQNIFGQIRSDVRRNELKDPKALRQRLKECLLERLSIQPPDMDFRQKPFVILVVGVNGVGKTTTIAKLAHNLKKQGKSVLLVAADTFRAAAVEQLEAWGRRIGAPVIKHGMNADPSAVAYDGMEAAVKRNVDVVIVDTAGRLHTKVNLMEELKKIRRVLGKKIPGAPHEVLLILDATTGQNAISQARLFNEAARITSIALTKLDGTAKGGIAASITSEMKIPIRYIGIGEGMEDLRPFDPAEFVEALFSRD